MNPKTNPELIELIRRMQIRHPDWSQDKREWVALKALGML